MTNIGCECWTVSVKTNDDDEFRILDVMDNSDDGVHGLQLISWMYDCTSVERNKYTNIWWNG